MKRGAAASEEVSAAKRARLEDAYVIALADQSPAALDALTSNMPWDTLADLFFVSKAWHDKVLAHVASNATVQSWAAHQHPPPLIAIELADIPALFTDFAIFRDTMSKTCGPRFGRIYHYVVEMVQQGRVSNAPDRWRSALQLAMRLNALASLFAARAFFNFVGVQVDGGVIVPDFMSFSAHVQLLVNDYDAVPLLVNSATHFVGRNAVTINTRKRDRVILRNTLGAEVKKAQPTIRPFQLPRTARIVPRDRGLYELYLDPEREPHETIRYVVSPYQVPKDEVFDWTPWPNGQPYPQATFRVAVHESVHVDIELLTLDVDIWMRMAANFNSFSPLAMQLSTFLGQEMRYVVNHDLTPVLLEMGEAAPPSLKFLSTFFGEGAEHPYLARPWTYQPGVDDRLIALAYGWRAPAPDDPASPPQDLRPMHYWKAMHCHLCHSAEVTCGDRATATLYCAECAEKM